MQRWVSFALLSSYKIFRTAVKNKKVQKSYSKVTDIFCPVLVNFEFLDTYS